MPGLRMLPCHGMQEPRGRTIPSCTSASAPLSQRNPDLPGEGQNKYIKF